MYDEIHLSDYLSGIRDILLKAKESHWRYEEATFTPLFSRLIESSNFNMHSLYQQKSIRTGNKPDFTIESDGNIIGCIECKNISINLNSEECYNQVKKYLLEYNNVILTNFIEFRLYQNSNMTDMMQFDNIYKPNSNNIKDFSNLISNFFKYGSKISKKRHNKEVANENGFDNSSPLFYDFFYLLIGLFAPIFFKNIVLIISSNWIKPNYIFLLIPEILASISIIIFVFIWKPNKSSISLQRLKIKLRNKRLWITAGSLLAPILTIISIGKEAVRITYIIFYHPQFIMT